jgi:hypothetical protein
MERLSSDTGKRDEINVDLVFGIVAVVVPSVFVVSVVVAVVVAPVPPTPCTMPINYRL